MKLKAAILTGLCTLLAGCSSEGTAPETAATPAAQKRWFTAQQSSQGEQLYRTNCAICHGARAEGAPNWRQPGSDGNHPAPPLNGTGHAWHHPLAILYRVIQQGSPGGQGGMPPWQGKLNEDETVAVIAWFQSQWSDEIYQAWLGREQASRSR